MSGFEMGGSSPQFAPFSCKVCGTIGHVETEYQRMGLCGKCVCRAANAFNLKHAGEPLRNFCTDKEWNDWMDARQQWKSRYRAPLDKALRRERLELDGYRCQQCGDHHRLCVKRMKHRNDPGPETVDDLLTLCRTCLPKVEIRK